MARETASLLKRLKAHPLAMGLAVIAAAFVIYQALSPAPPGPAGVEDIPPAALERPEPKPILPAGNLATGRAVGSAPKKRQSTNEDGFKNMQEQADALKITGIAPHVPKSRPRTAYEALHASNRVEPGSRAEILSYMRRFRNVQTAWRRAKRITVPIAGHKTVLLGKPQPQGKDRLATETDWAGDFSGSNTPGTRTISERSEWHRVWGGLSTSPPPEIDFSRSQVVAVFLGHRATGGFLVEIVDVSTTEALITVSYRELKPPPGLTPPEGASSPFALRLLPKSSLPVRFEMTD